jgi:hypothetical protein
MRLARAGGPSPRFRGEPHFAALVGLRRNNTSAKNPQEHFFFGKRIADKPKNQSQFLDNRLSK